MLMFCAMGWHRCRCGRSSAQPNHEGWYLKPDFQWVCDQCQKRAELGAIGTGMALIVLFLVVVGRVCS